MFETNTQENSGRISLAKASQLTGYHQDYLGQLCRLGKLEAVKVGRNWFTSSEALNNLTETAAVHEAEERIEQVAESLQDQTSIAQPVIAENITISEVDGMPVAIRHTPTAVRNTNSVQNILTNMRIESLQNEVMELRRLLYRLMEEVKTHTNIFESQEVINRVQDSLKHAYISNFDFSLPEQHERRAKQFEIKQQRESNPAIWQNPRRQRYALVNWVAATAAVLVLSFIGIGLATNSFFGEQITVSTVYHRQPEVAGADTSEPQTLPTDSSGELTPIMLR